MYKIEKVKVYDVNGYVLCAKDDESVKDYLSDLPEGMVMNIVYMKDSYVILTQREACKFTCKELQHMKFNHLYNTRERAMLYREMLDVGSDNVEYVS